MLETQLTSGNRKTHPLLAFHCCLFNAFTAALYVCCLYDCTSKSCIIFKRSQVQVLVLEADLYDQMPWGEEQERDSPFIGHGRKYTEWWWAMAEANKVKTFLSFYLWIATLYRTNGSSTSIPIPSFFPIYYLDWPFLYSVAYFFSICFSIKKPVSQPGSHLWSFDCNKLVVFWTNTG